MGWIRLIAKRTRKDNLSILRELDFLTYLMLGRSAASLPYLSDQKLQGLDNYILRHQILYR